MSPSAPSLSAVSHCISHDPSRSPAMFIAASDRIVPMAITLSHPPDRPRA